MLSEWNRSSILCRSPLHVPALSTPNTDSGTLAHLIGLGPLDEEVDALSGPAESCLVGWNLVSKLRFLTVNSLTLKKPKNPRIRAALIITRSCFFRGAVSNLCSM